MAGVHYLIIVLNNSLVSYTTVFNVKVYAQILISVILIIFKDRILERHSFSVIQNVILHEAIGR